MEVLGFAAMGDSAPMLEDAIFHRLGHEQSPEPLALNLNLAWEQFDGSVVTTDAKLLSRQSQSDGLRLTLQRGDIFFDATAPAGVVAEQLSSIGLNSTVRITGICLVRSGGLWQTPQSFRILVRLPGDVVVLATPSWWNARHILWLLGVTAGVLLGVIVWVVLLGRRLKEQMAIIRKKFRSRAVFER